MILDNFQSSVCTHGGGVAWSRRQYAPMHIHGDAMQSVRDQIEKVCPGYAVTFDVVFESPPDEPVAFHCDYESLGPFEVACEAIGESHFRSVHFNLTPDGGHLQTVDLPQLSRVHHAVISKHGIYSWQHALLNCVSAPVFATQAKAHVKSVNEGCVFNNLGLHSVTAAHKRRISYVVRLVRCGGRVWMSPLTVFECAKRSEACAHLTDIIAPHVHRRVDASTVAWKDIMCTALGTGSRGDEWCVPDSGP